MPQPRSRTRAQRAAEWHMLANLTPEELRTRLAELAQEESPDVYANCLEAVRLFAGVFTDPAPTPEGADAVANLRRLFPGLAHSTCVVAAEIDAAGGR